MEIDDAALGLPCVGLAKPPAWVSIRNASAPQMSGGSPSVEARQATSIYRRWGYTTTVGSAITCWALLAGRSEQVP